jgi:hypothetical protein
MPVEVLFKIATIMENKDITDEQILEEVKEIVSNPEHRRCNQCRHSNEACDWCTKLRIPLSKFMYAGHCRSYETEEQKLIRQTREAIEQQAKENRKVNHILTMSLNCFEIGNILLDDFVERVENEYKRAEKRGVGDARVRRADRTWMSTTKRAYKAIKTHAEGAAKQYQHYIMPMFNKVFNEDGRYDVEAYDDHLSDVFEMAEVLLRYHNAAFLNLKNAEKVMDMLKEMEGSEVFTEDDLKRYQFKR